MKKRLLSMLLVLCMTASLLPTLAFAADEGATTPVDQTAPADPPANKDPEGPANTTVAAAKIGDKEYNTLADAVEAAKAGDTIKIANDTTDTALVTIDKKITLDLNGKKYGRTNEGDKFIKIAAGGELIFTDSVGEGMLFATKDYAVKTCDAGLIQVSGGGSFVMESGYIYAVREDAENKGQFGVTVVEQNASFTINGGKIEAGWYAVSGNGSAGNGGTTITVNGGELISTADYGIYHPQVGTLKIQGGVVYGAAGGIAMNSGTLFLNDGTVTSKGVGSTGNWGDGTGGLSNAAIYLNAKYGNVDATINGGTLISEGNAVDVETGTAHTATLSVKSGTFSDMSWVPYAADGATVKLGADVEVNKTILIDKAVTLDLNGKTITSTVAANAGNTILVDGGKLTITDSTDKVGGIKDEVATHQAMKVKHGELRLEKGVYDLQLACSVTGAETDNTSYASAPYSYLYVGPDVTMNVNYWYAVLVGYANAETKANFGSKVDFHGTTTGCLYINGSVQATDGNVPVINVYSDAVIDAKPGSDAKTGEGNSAVYAAGYGVYNIEGGSLSGADAAIAIKAGKLNIKGGTLTCTGADSAPTEGWSNGVKASGAALQIESNKNYSNGGIEIKVGISVLKIAKNKGEGVPNQ